MNDLLSELLVRELERVLTSGGLREREESELAWLQDGLRASAAGGEDELRGDKAPRRARTLADRFFDEYLSLSEDELLAVSPAVHEWLLDRLMSNAPDVDSNAPDVDQRAVQTLGSIYRLYPLTTLSYTAMGALLQLDDRQRTRPSEVPAAQVWRRSSASDDVEPLAPDQSRDIADDIISYVDFLPDAVERALLLLVRERGRGELAEHLTNWAQRFGGDAETVILRALAGDGRFGSR